MSRARRGARMLGAAACTAATAWALAGLAHAQVPQIANILPAVGGPPGESTPSASTRDRSMPGTSIAGESARGTSTPDTSTPGTSAAPALPDATPNIAFFYSDPSRLVTLLQAYDAVVVAPSGDFRPADHALPHTAWIARVDLSHAAADTDNLSGRFVEQTLAPLWQQGYRGFAFDGLDALLAAGATPEMRATRAHNVATLIDTAAQRFAGARIVQYGGAELLPQSHVHVYAYVAGPVRRAFDPRPAGLRRGGRGAPARRRSPKRRAFTRISRCRSSRSTSARQSTAHARAPMRKPCAKTARTSVLCLM
ncbi:MAG: hypothetical protein WDN30_10770 [Pararobbsia sp.]